MRWVGFFVALLMAISLPLPAQAGAREAYERARLICMGALVSMATYNDRPGILARQELEENGWSLCLHKNQFAGVDANFFVVQNEETVAGKKIYILAVRGTENMNDVKTDLNISKIFFGGASPQAFAQAAEKKNLTSKDPMVHRGFNHYVQAAFFTELYEDETYGEELAGFLREDEQRILYMTGHSLGGAVAELAAARLVSMGVEPAQLRVVTYGAPAIGNEAFAAQYGARLPLERVVMEDDPVNGVLQSISGGYTQFGRRTVWHTDGVSGRQTHSIGIYVDAALRRFYDARRALTEAGMGGKEDPQRMEGAFKTYILPVEVKISKELAQDAYYMQASVHDSIRRSLSGGFVMAKTTRAREQSLRDAADSGCRVMLQPVLKISKLKKSRGAYYYVEYQENIYDAASGRLIGAMAHSHGTGEFTPLQSVIHDVAELRQQRLQVLDAAERQEQ